MLKLPTFLCAMEIVLGASATSAEDSADPWLQALVPQWHYQPLLQVGDGAGSYRMPDCRMAWGRSITAMAHTILINHELAGKQGTLRRHGAKGTFGSSRVIRSMWFDDMPVYISGCWQLE